jgi:hypothetical protein
MGTAAHYFRHIRWMASTSSPYNHCLEGPLVFRSPRHFAPPSFNHYKDPIFQSKTQQNEWPHPCRYHFIDKPLNWCGHQDVRRVTYCCSSLGHAYSHIFAVNHKTTAQLQLRREQDSRNVSTYGWTWVTAFSVILALNVLIRPGHWKWTSGHGPANTLYMICAGCCDRTSWKSLALRMIACSASRSSLQDSEGVGMQGRDRLSGTLTME